MKKRLRNALILALVTLFALGGTAAAVIYLHVTSVTVEVTEGVKDVAIYEDVEATQLWLTELISIEGNQAWLDTVYVKNQGSDNITVGLRVEGQTEFGLINFAPSGMYTLGPGEVKEVVITIYVLPAPPVGTYNFSIIVYEDE